MHLRIFMLGTLAAACSVGAVAQPTVRPGLYNVTSKMTAITARDMPPGMAELLTSQPTEHRKLCISPAASAELHKAVVPNTVACKAHNASGGGRIAVTATEGQCPAPVTFKIDGKHGATDFAFTIFSETPEGTTTWAHTGKRVGNCRW